MSFDARSSSKRDAQHELHLARSAGTNGRRVDSGLDDPELCWYCDVAGRIPILGYRLGETWMRDLDRVASDWQPVDEICSGVSRPSTPEEHRLLLTDIYNSIGYWKTVRVFYSARNFRQFLGKSCEAKEGNQKYRSAKSSRVV
jgi:hypothetical protein